MRKLLLFSCVLLPNMLKILIYKKIFKFNIGNNVKIGLSWIDAKKVYIGDDVRIGHLNIVKAVDIFNIGNSVYIGNRNSINGSKIFKNHSDFILGENVSITSRHFFDVAGGIIIENNSTIAGINSEFWSHGLDPEAVELTIGKVLIGSDTYIGSSVKVVPNVRIPSNSVVALGAIVTKDFYGHKNILLGGVPAKILKQYSKTKNYGV